MKPDEYIRNVLKTESVDFVAIKNRYNNNSFVRLDHASDGLCTEAGEFKDTIKKAKFYGKEIDAINLVEELGDILWYVGIACDVLGVSIEQVMERNIAKLKARYGEKFNEEGAINRDLENERNILNGSVDNKIHLILFSGADCTLCGLRLERITITKFVDHLNILKKKYKN